MRAVVALVFLLALAVRQAGVGDGLGRSFLPRPDAVEYAAGAQSIADDGTYLLRFGELRVRPRYPPGLSLLLAPALLAGVPGEALWRLVALASAALAALLAGLAGRLVRAVAPHAAPDARRAAERLAAALAGGLWAFAPIAVAGAVRVMSDDVAALAVVGTLAASLAVAVDVQSSAADATRTRRLASAAGLLLALAASVRPPAALLGALALVPLVVVIARRSPRRQGAVLLLAALLGALPPVVATAAVLVRSGEPAWRWSAYAFWEPDRFGPGGTAFAARHYLAVDPQVVAGRGERTNLELGARLLLGLPGPPARARLGELWPALAAPGLLLLVGAARRAGGAARALAAPCAAAAALLVAGHLAFWGAYYYPSPRFFLLPLAATTLCVAAAAGLLAAGARGAWRGLLAAGLVVLLAGTLRPALAARGDLRHEPRFGPAEVRARVAAWRALGADERARGRLEFDPVEAQALGLLDREGLVDIGAWGELPPTPHVRLLRARGLLPR